MAQINVWNATSHIVVLDNGAILDPAQIASADGDNENVKALLQNGEIINVDAVEETPQPLPSVEEMNEASAKYAAKSKSTKSKRNVSEDTEVSEENTVQLLSDSNNEVENETPSDSILPEDSE
jgi:hypothetical protein